MQPNCHLLFSADVLVPSILLSFLQVWTSSGQENRDGRELWLLCFGELPVMRLWRLKRSSLGFRHILHGMEHVLWLSVLRESFLLAEVLVDLERALSLSWSMTSDPNKVAYGLVSVASDTVSWLLSTEECALLSTWSVQEDYYQKRIVTSVWVASLSVWGKRFAVWKKS